MKKILTIAFFLTLAMSESTFGQIGLNFSGGINHSTCDFENVEGIVSKPRTGAFFGVGSNYQINKKVNFLVDFQYSQKGYKTDTENNLTGSEFRYSYLAIIPEIEYNLLQFLTLGIGMNYSFKSAEEFKFGTEDWSSTNGFGIIKSNDFGLTGKLKVGYNNIFGFVRYNIGLANIADVTFTDENGQEIVNAKQSNRNLQIGIGYTLNFKKN